MNPRNKTFAYRDITTNKAMIDEMSVAIPWVIL